MVKIYACKKATSNSMIDKNNVNPKNAPRANQFWNTNNNPTRLINTICPAEIFAYKRIINANGLIKTPNNSIGANTNFIGTGTPASKKCVSNNLS